MPVGALDRSRALLAGAACLLSSCAAHRGGTAGAPPASQRQVLLEVPFFPDRSDQCGPSTLASVLGFWGRDVGPGGLKEEIYSSRLKGSLSVDLLLAARAHGMRAEMFDGSLARVKAELDAGHPLIAFVNLGFRWVPIWHFVVLTGYDDARQTLYAHSGPNEDASVTYRKFSEKWEKTGRWTLLVLPPAG